MENENYTPETVETPVVEAAPAAEPVVLNAPAAGGPSAGVVMALGIIAIALSELGIPGLILAIIGKKKAKQYLDANGALTGMAKVGNILSKIALPISIIMIVFWIIYAIVIGFLSALAFQNAPIDYYDMLTLLF